MTAASKQNLYKHDDRKRRFGHFLSFSSTIDFLKKLPLTGRKREVIADVGDALGPAQAGLQFRLLATTDPDRQR